MEAQWWTAKEVTPVHPTAHELGEVVFPDRGQVQMGARSETGVAGIKGLQQRRPSEVRITKL